ncbi:hypothetical protein [Ruminococcus sp.]|uniref:hypothetical protein n=1 Tax=Ruminococcus sp. TaxID=41978 RepID=UPI0038701538
MKKSTDELLNILKSNSNLDDYFSENRDYMQYATLPQMLESLILSKKISKSEAINNSLIEKHYGYQIFKGIKTPSRDKLIMLCIGIGADLSQTSKLLNCIKASPLYAKDGRDAVIMFGILHRLSVIDINLMLYDRGYTPLE